MSFLPFYFLLVVSSFHILPSVAFLLMLKLFPSSFFSSFLYFYIIFCLISLTVKVFKYHFPPLHQSVTVCLRLMRRDWLNSNYLSTQNNTVHFLSAISSYWLHDPSFPSRLLSQ